MFRRLPPLHSLAAFESIARHQSFAKAAQELCLTQSAVSHRIRQLEDSVGARLLVRLNRGVTLTPAGARFLETVREALHQLHVAANAMSAGNRIVLRVSATPGMASNWLAHRMAEFQAKHPKIDLDVQGTMNLVNLKSGEADVCIRYGAGDWPGCHAAELFTDDLYVVCSPAYLKKLGPFNVPADLKRTTLLRTTPKLPWRPWFQAAGLDWDEPRTGPIFGEVPVLLDAAANGAGVALVGRIVSAPDIQSGRLVPLFDISVPCSSPYYAVCLAERRHRPEVEVFMEWLAAEARENAFKGTMDRANEREERLLAMIENLPAGALLVDGEGLAMNKAAEAITGYSRAELPTLGNWFKAVYGHRAPSARRRYEDDRANGMPVMRTSRILRKDGTERLVEFSSYLHPAGEVWLINDVTAQRAAEDRLQQLAYHDELTSLPNRLMLAERLRQALARARRTKRRVGMMLLDLDGLKQVNDELGHEAGDAVLKEVARRLRRCLREEDLAARIGGDEFAILVEDMARRSRAVRVAQRIVDALRAPVAVGTRKRRIAANVGMSVYPDDTEDSTELLKQADVALYRAKELGRNKFVDYGAAARAPGTRTNTASVCAPGRRSS